MLENVSINVSCKHMCPHKVFLNFFCFYFLRHESFVWFPVETKFVTRFSVPSSPTVTCNRPKSSKFNLTSLQKIENEPLSFQPRSSSQHIKHPKQPQKEVFRNTYCGKNIYGNMHFLSRKISYSQERDLCKAKLYYFLVHIY